MHKRHHPTHKIAFDYIDGEYICRNCGIEAWQTHPDGEMAFANVCAAAIVCSLPIAMPTRK
jgi:hypothetical protein